MGTRGLKICKGCRKSFEPQLTDSEIFELWFTEKEIEMDREHEEQSGHSHLEAPTQELCGKCSMDPEMTMMHNPLTGDHHYAPRRKMKRLKVQDMSEREFHVKASDGTPMTFTGNTPPPQDIVDMMNDMTKTLQRKTVKSEVKKEVTIITKKRPWWRFWK